LRNLHPQRSVMITQVETRDKQATYKWGAKV
jgi:hypothetical protein